MLLEHLTVSRKTAKDGKLEISEGAARELAGIAGGLVTVVDGERGAVRVERMACTCRGGAEAHYHYFVESELYKALPAGGTVAIELAEGEPTVVVTRL